MCNYLWILLKDELDEPSEQNWREIANDFKESAQFPKCLDAVNEKRIRINRFPHSVSMYLNYKGYFSIVIMAVADSDYVYIC